MASLRRQKPEDGGGNPIQSLIQSIAPEIASSSNGQLSKEEVTARLTDKLVELVGAEGMPSDARRRNERGEPLNEEGLPIIEITEPADPTDLRTGASRPIPVVVEPLINLTSLSDDARAKLRQKRDRILDLLEAEEKQHELAEKRQEVERIMEGARDHRGSEVKTKARHKEAKELQKKMGRALLQNFSKAKEQELKDQEEQRLRDEAADKEKRRSPSIKKKTVAFAESTEHIDGAGSESLTSGADEEGKKRPTRLAQALLDRHPMKLNVVERVPSGPASIKKPTLPSSLVADSDDESEPEAAPDSELDEEEDQPLETDEFDLDYAQHQRDVALEYYQKRGIIGQEAAQAMMNQPADNGGTRNDQKPAISQFKASRLASAYGAASPSTPAVSTSLEGTAIPTTTAHTLQKAIRTGSVDSEGNLVGGEGESASEEENEGLQEVLDLLRNGEAYNAGPDGEHLDNSSSTRAQSSTTSLTGEPQPRTDLPPPSGRSKTSKFKLSRSAAGRPEASSLTSILIPSRASDIRSASVTPVSHAFRSSPKMGDPMPLAEVSERNIFLKPASQPSVSAQSAFSMVIDSPSFPANFSTSSSESMAPLVIDSPSFAPSRPTTSARRPERPPEIMSTTVKESPSTRNIRPPAEEQTTTKVSRFKAERMS